MNTAAGKWYNDPKGHINQGLIDPKKAMSIPTWNSMTESFSLRIRYRSESLNVHVIFSASISTGW